MNKVHYNNVVQYGVSVNFGRVFALPLSRFFAPLSGFDRAAFAQALFHEADHLEDNVRRRYGDEAVAVLRKVDCVEPLSDSEKDEAAKHLGRYYVAAVSGSIEFQENTDPCKRIQG